MPSIFSNEERAVVRENLLLSGFELLKKYGYKKTLVEEIAKSAGIAKGTFYNFFKSKELFFYELMLYIRDKNRDKMRQLFSNGKPVTHDKLVNYLKEKYLEDETIYTYLTTEDLITIFRKLPKEQHICKEDSTAYAHTILAAIPNDKTKYNIDVVLNILNIMAISASNKELLHSKGYEETIEFLSNSLADYIFGI